MSLIDTLKSIVTFSDAEMTSPVEILNGNGATESYVAATEQPPLTWGWNRATWPTWDPMQGSAAYGRLALIYRCVNIVAHSLGTAPIRVYDDSNADEEIADHALRQLMKRPNPMMGEASFWSHVGTRAAIAGFCVVEKERDRLGNVIALWPLQSTWLKAKARRDGTHDWEYRVPGIVAPFLLKAENVISFTWADTPNGSPYGMGPLEACLREVSLNNALIDFVKAYVERGAAPVFAIIPSENMKPLTQQEAESFIDAWVARRAGLKNAVRPAYFQGIKDIKPIGNNLEEMAYTALRDMNELGIIQAFGIPASVAQIRVGLEHSDSRANAEVDEGKLYRQTIIPLWTRFDDVLTLGLLPEYPNTERLSLEFDTSDIQALQEDRNNKAERLNPAVSGGWLSVHAWHREMGLPLPAGDDYYLRPMMVEAIPVTEPIPEPEPVPAALQPGNGTVDENELSAIGDQFQRELLKILAETRPPQLMLHATTQSTGYRRRYARAQSGRALIAKIAAQREPSIRRYLDAQGKRIVGTVVLSATQPGETYALQDVDWNRERDELERVLRQLYILAGSTAYDAVNAEIGASLSFDLANPHLSQTERLLATRVTEITDATKADIAQIVTASHTEGVTIDELRNRLIGLYDETYANRSLTIARTESMSAFGYASAAGYRESGVVDRIQCFDNPTHGESYGASDGLTCAERNGLIDSLDSAERHIDAEHPNGSLAIAGVLTGEEV